MNYQYDLADFKRFLNDKNSKYRVDGLIFWQNRIPLPIDLFNQIFNESDLIISDYIHQIVASAVAFSNQDSFEQCFEVQVNDLPNSSLKKQSLLLRDWLNENLSENSAITSVNSEIADILGLKSFVLSIDKVVAALQHQGKKYSRLYIPHEIREKLSQIPNFASVGLDNTDMFGNIIADRYNVYRSGFSDALAIIFNALLEFRLLFSRKGGHLPSVRVITPIAEDVDVRLGKTKDGSLWEPGYEDDHFIILNIEHPLVHNLPEEQSTPLIELLFYLAVFENSQYSDQNKKLVENLRQTVSRSLWIKND